MTSTNTNKTQVTYVVLPPPMPPNYNYQDVNLDPNLRLDVINYFYNKLLKWISSSRLYTKYSEHENYIFNNKYKVKQKIYKLLRYFVKKANINWYDLRSNNIIIKEFFSKKFDLLL